MNVNVSSDVGWKLALLILIAVALVLSGTMVSIAGEFWDAITTIVKVAIDIYSTLQ